MKAKTSEPKFSLIKDERCPDCEYNGHLSNDGQPIKGAPLCGNCSGGRIHLLTWDDVLAVVTDAKKLTNILTKLDKGRARIVRPSDLLDPYLIRKKG